MYFVIFTVIAGTTHCTQYTGYTPATTTATVTVPPHTNHHHTAYGVHSCKVHPPSPSRYPAHPIMQSSSLVVSSTPEATKPDWSPWSPWTPWHWRWLWRHSLSFAGSDLSHRVSGTEPPSALPSLPSILGLQAPPKSPKFAAVGAPRTPAPCHVHRPPCRRCPLWLQPSPPLVPLLVPPPTTALTGPPHAL